MNLKSLLIVFSNHHDMKVEILDSSSGETMYSRPRLNMGAFGHFFMYEVIKIKYNFKCLYVSINIDSSEDYNIYEFKYIDLLKILDENTKIIFTTNMIKQLNDKVLGINCYNDWCLEIVLPDP